MTINDEQTDLASSKEKTPVFRRIPKTPQIEIPRHISQVPLSEPLIMQRTPKKTQLERMTIGGTTSTMLRAIKRVKAERLPEYFEQTCNIRPQETAVICGSSQLTYEELDQRANRLAHFLIAHNIGKGQPIGMLLARSLDSYVALLGILKAGAAFVPLDPAFATERVAFIAQDAGLSCIVTNSAFREKTRALNCPVLELDQAAEAIAAQYETRPQVRVDPASLCYIIYTTDDRDWPAGMAFSHSNIVNFLREFTLISRVRRGDRVYHGMPMTSDISIAEIWQAWCTGAALVTAPVTALYNSYILTDFLIEQSINIFYCIPAQLARIERDVPSLHTILIVGKTCPADLIDRWWQPQRRIIGTYGPIETTIITTWCELHPNRPTNIGKPLPISQIYILDNQLRPVRDGESGEIYIGGLGVAQSYVNRPDLTSERFILNPVRNEREIVPRLYRTGDLGRITLTGELEYLGPMNAQVSLHGYRAELAEIERTILPQVNEALRDQYASMATIEIRIKPDSTTEPSRLAWLKRINVKEIFNQIMTDPLYRNSIFSMASTLILGGLGFVFWIIIARLYNPADVGIATALISVMSLLSSLTLLGLNISINRYLPKSANKSELINSTFVIITIATIVACAIFLLGLQSFSPQLLFLRSNIFYVISFTILVIFCAMNTIVESIFMAFRSTGNTLLKNMIISVSKLALPFALVALSGYGVFVSSAMPIALGVLASIIILIFKFKLKPAISINVPLIKEISAYSFANYATDFTLYMPSQIMPIVILNVLSAKYVAYFYIASQIQSILQVIPLTASQALLTEGAYNEDELKNHLKKAFKTILVMLVPATVIIILFGNILLQTFGKSYADEAFRFMQLYCASTIFTALLYISNAILNVKRQMKSLIISNILATVLALSLPYVFLSSGLTGLGWGWILGQAATGGMALFFIIPHTFSATSARKGNQ